MVHIHCWSILKVHCAVFVLLLVQEVQDCFAPSARLECSLLDWKVEVAWRVGVGC